MRVHGVAGLTLSLQPSPGNSHTMVAKATGVQTLTAPKQVRTTRTRGIFIFIFIFISVRCQAA
ncbi:Transmembrane protein 132E [Liparis tanakae]|uniref:Transmembrane protein 132E n=1 Tax=Liparis tanakae TaxID=230148 RepID=A0A4Z2DZ52_9TELE|nr:Transmembrane protein 132E [Liparis tanakae]